MGGVSVGEQFTKSAVALRRRLIDGDCQSGERIATVDTGTMGSESLTAFLGIMNTVARAYPQVIYNVIEDPEPAANGDIKVNITTTGMAVDLLVFFLLCATSGVLEYAG
jgi:hypothetical protein